MVGTKLFTCGVIVWLMTSSRLSARAEEKPNDTRTDSNEIQGLSVFPGIEFFLEDSEIAVRVRIRDLLRETDVKGRSEGKKNPLQRFGFMMMMTPFVMQILSLPGAIASIKMSLLKSIMVAQLAIALMIYNFIRSAENTGEIVVIHQPQHHAHYHHTYHHPEDDDEDEWFGR